MATQRKYSYHKQKDELIMKKTYQEPAFITVTLKPHVRILAGSPGLSLKSGYANKNEEVLSPQNSSFWDDEDE
jgi:hypothetical protein